ncbi:hypothetical protein D1872_256070 [compost metagenome]
MLFGILDVHRDMGQLVADGGDLLHHDIQILFVLIYIVLGGLFLRLRLFLLFLGLPGLLLELLQLLVDLIDRLRFGKTLSRLKNYSG